MTVIDNQLNGRQIKNKKINSGIPLIFWFSSVSLFTESRDRRTATPKYIYIDRFIYFTVRHNLFLKCIDFRVVSEVYVVPSSFESLYCFSWVLPSAPRVKIERLKRWWKLTQSYKLQISRIVYPGNRGWSVTGDRWPDTEWLVTGIRVTTLVTIVHRSIWTLVSSVVAPRHYVAKEWRVAMPVARWC